MGADPITAARNVTKLDDIERRATEIRTLVAKGIISDGVGQLARIMANRLVSGPEEEKLKDVFLREAIRYVQAVTSGPAALEYMSPNDQARRVEEQSRGLAELEHQRAEAVGGDLEQGLRQLTDAGVALPKAKVA
jgi:hypothetical protein